MQQLFDGAGNRRFELEYPAAPGLPGGRVYEFDSLARLTTSAPAPLAPFGATAFEPSDVPLPTAALTGQQLIDATIAQVIQGAGNFTSYEYDAAGNRLAERVPGLPPTLYTPNALNEYADVGGTALAYDLNGNLLDDGQFRYRYNYRNQLVGVLDAATGADVSKLWYDTLGQLIAVEANGQPTVLINDGPHVVEEYRGAVLTSQYVNEDEVDRHCQVATGAAEWWCHRDVLGSTSSALRRAGPAVAGAVRLRPVRAAAGRLGGDRTDAVPVHRKASPGDGASCTTPGRGSTHPRSDGSCSATRRASATGPTSTSTSATIPSAGSTRWARTAPRSLRPTTPSGSCAPSRRSRTAGKRWAGQRPASSLTPRRSAQSAAACCASCSTSSVTTS